MEPVAPSPLPNPQSNDTPPPAPEQPQPPPSSSSLPSTPFPSIPTSSSTSSTPSSSSSSNPNPNPNPNQIPRTPSAASSAPFFPQTGAPLTRPWPPPSPHFLHFQSPLPPPSASSSPAVSSAAAAVASQKGGGGGGNGGGIAMGYPAATPGSGGVTQPPVSSLPASFSGSFGNQYGGGIVISQGNVVTSEGAVSSSAPASARHVIHSMQGVGIMGSQIRPNAAPAQQQQRPVQSSPRPQAASINQPSSQNFQGLNPSRPSSVAPTSISTPSTSQSHQSQNQPWLSSAPHGRPPLPSPAFKSPVNPQSLQQRSNAAQQTHHAMAVTPQQQNFSSPQLQLQPFTLSNQSQEQYAQNMSSSWASQPLPNQQLNRVQGLGNQRSPSTAMVQSGSVQAISSDRAAVTDMDESSDRILSKRSIKELVNQMDPSEHLDPEVEDVLLDIAEEFVDSITTFGCTLAKHRKSSTLEAKDILLHLERNWNMTLPGFGGDEIKTYKKQLASDAHREQLAAVRNSRAVTEVVNTKASAGQGAGNIKGHPSKGPSNVMGS